ncbi:chemotaxis protein CheD [Desulfonatronum thioautotrophicum]|uniref:chemotaxis protein CheD n=1 Tax=Desulfonatronum thioautotrophicum TaxID=617001 RepID=UPI0005EB2786|nr:chemotaxis protein CheD [Desulfonatronum thioautotrophicum]
MYDTIQASDYFVRPGYVCVPVEPTRLAVVAASGVAVTLYDAGRRRGGMSHYIRPVREAGLSTPMFAAPAIVTLAEMLFAAGSTAGDLEAHLYGGAENSEAQGYLPGLGRHNVQVGEELLDRLGIALAGRDVGGTRARKVVFHSATGECVVARVERVRETDWYPDCIAL